MKTQLEAIRAQYHTGDIGIVTVCYDFADRVRSYELVAEVCGLKAQHHRPDNTSLGEG